MLLHSVQRLSDDMLLVDVAGVISVIDNISVIEAIAATGAIVFVDADTSDVAGDAGSQRLAQCG